MSSKGTRRFYCQRRHCGGGARRSPKASNAVVPGCSTEAARCSTTAERLLVELGYVERGDAD
jgi:hypothetical protein